MTRRINHCPAGHPHGPGSVLCVALLTFAWVANGQETFLPARVAKVSGQVRCTSDAKTWRALRSGEAITAGLVLETGKKGSAVELEMGVNPTHRVRLTENSTLAIKGVRPKEQNSTAGVEIRFDLRAGQLLGSLGGRAAGLDCEVDFPTGVVGARGDAAQQDPTVFVLTSKGALGVASGRMVIALANGSEPQVVAAGQQFDPATGRVTALPSDAAVKLSEALRAPL